MTAEPPSARLALLRQHVTALRAELRARSGALWRPVSTIVAGMETLLCDEAATDAEPAGSVACEVSASGDAERTARMARDLTDQLMHFTHALFVEVNPAGRITLMNAALLGALGYRLDEVIGRDYADLVIPAADREMFRSRNALLAGGVDPARFANYVNRLLTRDGRELAVVWSAGVVRDDQGRAERVFGVGIDITERQRAQDELRRERDFAEGLIDTAQALVVVVDPAQHIVRVNRRVEELTGTPADRLRGQRFGAALLVSEHDPETRGLLASVTTAAGRRGVVAPLRTPTGTEALIRWHGCALHDADGAVTGYLGVGHDITDLVRMQRALRDSEAELRALFDSVSEALVLLDTSGRVRAINRIARENAVAYNGRRLRRGESLGDFLQPEHAALHEQLLRAALAGESGFVEHQIAATGEWWEIHYRPVPDVDGQAWAVCVTMLSVTAHKRAQAALRESEERYRLLADNATDMISRHDLGFVYRYASPASQALLGYCPAELLDRSGFELCHPEDQAAVSASFERTQRQSGPSVVEHRLRHRDGAWVWVETSSRLAAAPDSDEAAIISVTRNITARREIERRIREHQEELVHAGRLSLMGEMASGLAHELNQPLCSIAAAADGGLRSLATEQVDRSVLSASLTLISEEAHRAGEIIRRIRSFGRKQQSACTMLDLNRVVAEALALLAADTRALGISIQQDLDPALPPVLGDRIELQQVVLNLARNGLDALVDAPAARRTLRVSTAAQPNGDVLVAVCDYGSGLTPEVAAHLFEPFFTTKPNGMGLGLSISQTIVERHRGRLWATPNLSTGTTFCFTLPATRSNRDRSAADGVHCR